MKKLIVFVFFYLIHINITFAYNDEYSFTQSADLLNRGMYLEALDVYNEISNYSKNINNRARALLFIGTTYSLYLNQYDDALKQFDYIQKIYPESSSAEDALYNKGIVYFEKKNYKEAYKAFTQYINKYPNGIRLQSSEVWANSAKEYIKGFKSDLKSSFNINLSDFNMRILIKSGINKLSLFSNKNIIVSNFLGKNLHYEGHQRVIVTNLNGHIAINGETTGVDSCSIISSDRIIGISGFLKCRGKIIISTYGANGLNAINVVTIEEYLYGVIPKEMPSKWAIEALMAQSVAARTYALYIKEKSRDKFYDIEANTYAQVYGGYDAETFETNKAVDLTRGEVMLYDNRLIIAYFHSNSGGYTEDAKYVWNADIPYLKGIPDKFSENVPNGTWQYEVSFDDIKERLNRCGLNINNILDIKPIGKSRSGRNLKITIVSDKGDITLTGNNFRLKIGSAIIKSLLFNIKNRTNTNICFYGTGYGHGVGMSQYGALRMAEVGYDYKTILKYYYQSVKLVRMS